jgi:hypothetical protein
MWNAGGRLLLLLELPMRDSTDQMSIAAANSDIEMYCPNVEVLALAMTRMPNSDTTADRR